MQNVTAELEAMIDAHGLTHVLTGLSLVCAEKAEHIRANWQDRITAKPWDKASNEIEQLARKVAALGI